MTTEADLRKMVFENLDASKENGYFEPGEMLHGSTPEDIAMDMIAFASDAEDIDDPTVLVPFISEWLKLCQDEGCPHSGTPHVCGDAS